MSYCWTQASSQIERAWTIVPPRAHRGLEMKLLRVGTPAAISRKFYSIHTNRKISSALLRYNADEYEILNQAPRCNIVCAIIAAVKFVSSSTSLFPGWLWERDVQLEVVSRRPAWALSHGPSHVKKGYLLFGLGTQPAPVPESEESSGLQKFCAQFASEQADWRYGETGT